jgi:toxin ParE1/3/4
MAKIVWSPSALRDLEGILAYIAKDAPVAARRFGEKILARTRQLKTVPLLGGFVVEDSNQSYRELLHGNYRIIYRYDDGKTAYIVAVHHAAKLLDLENLD